MRIFYEAWESAFNRQPMADEFNRVDFLPIGFRPAYKNNCKYSINSPFHSKNVMLLL